jgi:hypothetical protein
MVTIPAVLDLGHEYVSRASSSVMPQVAVFVRGQPVYSGRVDDRYVGTGKARQGAAHHDPEEVLADVAAGKIPPLRETKAAGCAMENPQ